MLRQLNYEIIVCISESNGNAPSSSDALSHVNVRKRLFTSLLVGTQVSVVAF